MPPTANYDEAKVPHYVLPDPLVSESGMPVGSPEQWRSVRRPELLHLFQQHIYGTAPHRPRATAEAIGEPAQILGGIGLRHRYKVTLTPGPDPLTGEMLLFTPARAGKYPAFVELNFWGNHSISSDPAVPISSAWFVNHGKGIENNRATGLSRGCNAAAYPLELIVSRGYALASLCYADVEPDRADGWRESLRGRMERMIGYPANRWGAICAWAWALQCELDCLESIASIDASRVAVVGHSRLGKAAVWAGATDERFAAVISNNSGEGGVALSRRCFGETVEHITGMFPHWFVPRFREYASNEQALPIDQHELVSLMAPRLVYIASAAEDLWADPRGEFLSAVHADCVFRLLGKPGLGTTQMPPRDTPVGRSVGYHIRSGAHAITRYDWQCFMDFLDRS